MPLPLALAPIGAGIAKLGTALKGLGAAKTAAGLGMNAAYLGKGAAAGAKVAPGIAANIKAAGIGAARQAASIGGPQGISFGGIKRFAGNALNNYMGPGGVTAGNVAANFAPDLVFGAMQGAMTPGDLGDKLIAGTTTAVGGALGGVGAVSAMGKYGQTGGGRMLAEFGGGMLGDMGGQMVGDTVLRAKGGGMTPWERLQQEGDQEYRQQLERQVLAQYGIGGYNQTDLLGM